MRVGPDVDLLRKYLFCGASFTKGFGGVFGTNHSDKSPRIWHEMNRMRPTRVYSIVGMKDI